IPLGLGGGSTELLAGSVVGPLLMLVLVLLLPSTLVLELTTRIPDRVINRKGNRIIVSMFL
ncbi:MAG: hypothetical protein WB501_03750, partial [Nitrososphaeraceae archaeon]